MTERIEEINGKVISHAIQNEIGEDDLDGFIRIYFTDNTFIEISTACSYHDLFYFVGKTGVDDND